MTPELSDGTVGEGNHIDMVPSHETGDDGCPVPMVILLGTDKGVTSDRTGDGVADSHGDECTAGGVLDTGFAEPALIGEKAAVTNLAREEMKTIVMVVVAGPVVDDMSAHERHTDGASVEGTMMESPEYDPDKGGKHTPKATAKN